MVRPGVSVVITFYNEVEFLDLALSSVLTQNINEIEVIIINDNPDHFDDSFFQRGGYINKARVIHHNANKGLSAARNTGIHAAIYEHIAFLDADDYYLPGGLKKHYTHSKGCGADITHAHTILARINRNFGRLMSTDLRMSKTVFLTGEARLTGALERVHSWASIYKRDFLINNNIFFDVAQRKFEDRLFIVESMIAANTIAIFAEPVRVWRRRANSISTSRKSLEESRMKLDLFEKCVWAWRNSDVENKRYYQSAEVVRHAINLVFQDDIAEWVNLEHKELIKDSQSLKEQLRRFLTRENVSLEEIEKSIFIHSHRYAKNESGNGKITAKDLYDYISAIIEGDGGEMKAISKKARVKEQQIPILSERLEGGTQEIDSLKIYIHFGTHKTGSTFVQQQLNANYDTLKAQGILFPKTGFGFHHNFGPVRPNGLPGHQGLIVAMKKSDPNTINALQDEIKDSGCNKIIISAENLCDYETLKAGVNSANIAQSLARLKLKGAFIPVIYFRRPDHWIDSFYREDISNGGALAYQHPDEYFNNQQNRLNYAETVRTIEAALGHEARIASFDSAVAGEGLLQSFLRLCDSSDVISHLTISGSVSRYVSPCNAQIRMSRLISSLVSDKTVRANILRSFYALTLPTDQKSPLISIGSQDRAIQIFKKTSAKFLEQRGVDMKFDAWSASPVSVEVNIPDSYLNILAQIGVMHQTEINSRVSYKNKAPSDLERVKTAFKYNYKEALKLSPRPIRAFANIYLKLTNNSAYKTLRKSLIRLG
ncbi:glycosyltransferase family 2 protein [Loktanella sp. SALINAS62]|uniref:glycosyltransferase family 2 protein n=1 Tax=Loktanella sp. SALINAS62 TaxID=2706124 RepID=UPI001B8BCE98|nr:glycosyltransferase family 2 protein [Loktanella sp. SALINAS62]MBS1303045.1 glycosyltransferase family 2 protein [Loktanella sp. SALINAS62]